MMFSGLQPWTCMFVCCFQDYNHELVCITEREKFVVPVKAIGSRAVLDFPDNVHFPPGPVKYTHSRTYLVRNIGNREAKFTLTAEKYVYF